MSSSTVRVALDEDDDDDDEDEEDALRNVSRARTTQLNTPLPKTL